MRGGNEMTDKRCTKCGTTKPSTEFSKNRNSKDGLQSWCKSCARLFYKKHLACVICGEPLLNGRVKYCTKCSPMPQTCCDFLRVHHDIYKDDPERLSTEFIKELMHCKCEVKQ